MTPEVLAKTSLAKDCNSTYLCLHPTRHPGADARRPVRTTSNSNSNSNRNSKNSSNCSCNRNRKPNPNRSTKNNANKNQTNTDKNYGSNSSKYNSFRCKRNPQIAASMPQANTDTVSGMTS